MPKKRVPLTLEEHRQVSAHLLEAEAAMSKVLDLLNNRVPAPVVDQLTTGRGFDKALYQLRSSLEDLMFAELGRQGGADLRVYYPAEGPGRR